jgi:hypothetical protein
MWKSSMPAFLQAVAKDFLMLPIWSPLQAERNHQGVGNRLLEPLALVSSNDETIHCRERLGGMLNYYCRVAA